MKFKDAQDKEISVATFFRTTHNITLQYPDLPCIQYGYVAIFSVHDRYPRLTVFPVSFLCAERGYAQSSPFTIFILA